MSGGDIMAGWQEGLDAGELRIPRCDACSSWNWYPLPRCRACGSAAQRWISVPPAGTLYSWTRVHKSFAEKPVAALPYVTGIVDIDAAPGVRLVCLQRPGSEAPRVGRAVRLALQSSPSGRCWVFEPDGSA